MRTQDLLKSPSLRSFIQVTTAGDQDVRLNGLAVYLQLTNACQALEDVSKAKVQLHKIALVTLKNNSRTRCSFQKLTVNAQNAGYTVLINFADSSNLYLSSTHEDKLLIPFLNVAKECTTPDGHTYIVDDVVLTSSDLTNVEIRVPLYEQPSFELIKMQSYLNRLFYWFLLGPIITLEWLRRSKSCRMSGIQHLDNNGQGENEVEIRTIEEPSTNESYRERDDELQWLLDTLPTVIYTRQPRGTRYVKLIKKIFVKIAVGFLYLILVIVALPVGISLGGLSFFRFDQKMYGDLNGLSIPYLDTVWPLFQIFCFFVYSRLACKITWTIQNEFSKLIRSDWFASNIYLLGLGVVVPYCSLTVPFYCFATNNIMCTVCNMLFIFILNKHKVVTRYVFYISICMICAYIESDVVAVFYFAQNSQGSFIGDIKLTALRTVAIGLTLTVSLNSSMHIFRKLVKPRESLFSGLSEK